MRLTRILVWSTGILLAWILVGCLLVAFFFPWDSFEQRLNESLNDRLQPLRIDYAKLRPFLRDGPGITIDELRVFASGSGAGQDALLYVRRLTFRPSIEDLAGLEVAGHLVVEAPALRRGLTDGEAPAVAGIVGAIARGIGVLRKADQSGAPGRSRPETLSGLIPLPGGFTLTGGSLEIRDGSLDAFPPAGMTGAQASVRVENDLSFQVELTNGALRWHSEEKDPLRLSAMVGAEIRGRALPLDGGGLEGTVRLGETELEWRGGTAKFAEPIELAFRLEGNPDGFLSVPKILLTGPGMEIGLAGSTRWSDEGPGRIEIRDLSAKVESWQPFCSLLSLETALSGKLSLAAERVEIEPARLAPPALPEGSFRPAGPEGLSCEGLELRLAEGRLSGTDIGGASVSLDGVEIRLKQQDHGWAGATDLAGLSARLGEAVQFSGPAAIEANWSEEGSVAEASLVVDLTRGRLVFRNLLDKPSGVSLRLEVRTRIRPDEIRVEEASLGLGDTQWALAGSVREPARPILNARLAPNTVSLAALAEVLPAARQHEVGGLLEINELSLTGRLGNLKESALSRARLATKDFRLRGSSVQGLYAQAVYEKQLLTISPVVVQPATGMIELVFSADFSETFLDAGLHQYYGTLRVDHVDIEELTGLAAPGLAGKAHGRADVNLAFRGSGFSWPEAAAGLEARARVRLNRVALQGEDHPDGNSGESLAGRLGHLLDEIDAEETVPQEEGLIDPEQERLLTENRAAGWFSMREGIVLTDNLVAIHDGRLMEIHGSVDLTGRLRVERGKLLTGGRVVPFRLDCVLGKERCRPSPDPEETRKSAAAELSAGLDILSEAAKGVYGDLDF